MSKILFPDWISQNHHRFRSLTTSVQLIVESLLKDEGIPYLAITGRTKSEADCLDKVRRKRYVRPLDQLTDISGIRIVVYFDYDVERVSDLITANFNVDEDNSSNRDELMSVNEVGYRSVHYVCDLGEARTQLREHLALKGLKFEFQVRTVLQHAWAELAHDRNYKFSGQLPKEIERKLFLLAALMETADNGFSELSREVDAYMEKVSASTAGGRLAIEVNSITVEEFVKQWAFAHEVELEEIKNRDAYKALLKELEQYGIRTIDELNKIVPPNYKHHGRTTVLGVVRDWMLISNPLHFISNVQAEWSLMTSDLDKYEDFLTRDQLAALENHFNVVDDDHSPVVWDHP
jgi:ppGpp synthetase/RelA/SpoT-type nucleotidyltranferase